MVVTVVVSTLRGEVTLDMVDVLRVICCGGVARNEKETTERCKDNHQESGTEERGDTRLDKRQVQLLRIRLLSGMTEERKHADYGTIHTKRYCILFHYIHVQKNVLPQVLSLHFWKDDQYLDTTTLKKN